MRSLVVAALAVTALAGVLAVACDSFSGSDDTTPAPDRQVTDASSNDAPSNDARANDAGVDAEAGSFCATHSDAGVFCFDFDTAGYEPTWSLNRAVEDGGTSAITLDQNVSSSPPTCGFFEVKQPLADAGGAVATINRSVYQDMSGLDLELDVSVDTLNAVATLVYVQLFDAESGGSLTCAFGLNANVQGAAALIATQRTDAGAYYYLEDLANDAFLPGFKHVSLHWTQSPPSVSATIGSATIGPLMAPNCVPSKRAEVSLGFQAPIPPVEARMHLDSILWSFKP